MAVQLWFKDLCQAYLDFNSDDFDLMLKDKSSPGKNGSAFDDFLSNATGRSTALYVYSIKSEREVAMKVKVMREVQVEEEVDVQDGQGEDAVQPTNGENADGASAAPNGDGPAAETKAGENADGTPAAAADGAAASESKEGEKAEGQPAADGAATDGNAAAPGGEPAADGGAAAADGQPAQPDAAPTPAADGADAQPDGGVKKAKRMVTKMIEEERMEMRKVAGYVVHARLQSIPTDISTAVAYFIKTRVGPVVFPPPGGSYSAPPLPTAAAPAPAPAAATEGAAEGTSGSPPGSPSAGATRGGGTAGGSGAAPGAGGLSVLAAAEASPTIDDYMVDCVEYGSVTADLLGSMEVVMREVFTPFLEPQLGGKIGGSGDDAMADGDNENQSVVSGMQGMGGASGIIRNNRGGGGGTVLGGGGGGGGGTVIGGGTVLGGASTVGGRTGGLQSYRSGMVGGTVIGGSSGIHGGGTIIPGTVIGGLTGTLGMTGAVGGGVPTAPTPVEEDRIVQGVSESIKGEFRSALHRFSTVITHTLQQINGDVRLTIPENVDVSDPGVASQDEAIKAVLIDAVEDWTRIIMQVLSVVTDKDKGSRPIQEVEFWRGRNATLSTIWEQLNMPTAKNMLTTLEIAREPVLDSFRSVHAELSKAYVEARDNVKFLSTLERHFKNLSTGSLSAILETIPSLMNGLRMVWIISRHYNTDDQMLPLMKRIVNELVDKVSSEVNIKSILRLAKTDPKEALEVMAQAKAVLDTWHSTYLLVRERIEKSTDHRW